MGDLSIIQELVRDVTLTGYCLMKMRSPAPKLSGRVNEVQCLAHLRHAKYLKNIVYRRDSFQARTTFPAVCSCRSSASSLRLHHTQEAGEETVNTVHAVSRKAHMSHHLSSHRETAGAYH